VSVLHRGLAMMYVDRRLGGIEKWYLHPPPDYDMRVPDELRKCVVFIGVTVRSDQPDEPSEQPRYEGTGFFVALPSTRVDDILFTYLVTAKHVADNVEGDFWVRQNLVSGPAVAVDCSAAQWTRHPTDMSADVAVLPWPLQARVDHLAIPVDMMIPNRKDLAGRLIGVGDEVFLTGVFVSAYGKQRNMPIVRKGNIAMLPEDKIPTADLGEIDAYLVEAHSSGGISGSPVFVRETIQVPVVMKPKETGGEPENVFILGAGRHYLLGLMHGHWQIDADDVNALYLHSPEKSEPGVNLGISIVVPAQKIIETLDHPDLAQKRKAVEDDLLAKQALPTPDAVSRAVRPASESLPGPEPERLVIEGDWENAVRRGLQKGKPPKGAR
jgi:hypothetical protein